MFCVMAPGHSSTKFSGMFVRGFEPPHDNVLNVTPLPLGYTNKAPKEGVEPPNNSFKAR